MKRSYNKQMKKIAAKRVQDKEFWGGEGDSPGNVLEIKIWPNEYMVYAQPRIHSGERDVYFTWGVEIKADHVF